PAVKEASRPGLEPAMDSIAENLASHVLNTGQHIVETAWQLTRNLDPLLWNRRMVMVMDGLWAALDGDEERALELARHPDTDLITAEGTARLDELQARRDRWLRGEGPPPARG